jgi:glycosyltransferase involved in cell wall biosynthesis
VGLHVLADVPLFQTSVSPNKVYDYMAAGLPVVTNTPGVVGDLIERADAGIVAGPSGIAAALREAYRLDREGGLRAKGVNAREWILSNQSRSQMARRLRDVLSELQ